MLDIISQGQHDAFTFFSTTFCGDNYMTMNFFYLVGRYSQMPDENALDLVVDYCRF